MAGIGFSLQQITKPATYVGGASTYLFSAVISSGPWLTTVTTLALLNGLTVGIGFGEDRSPLFATISYVFASSLVLTGGLQMIVTRFLADRLYVGDLAAFAPTFTGVLLAIVPLLMVLSLAFLVVAPFGVAYDLLAINLFVTVSLIWLVMAFLSAARDYLSIVLAFAVGQAVGLAATVFLGDRFGITGMLGGWSFGEAVCLMLLIERVSQEFPDGRGVDFRFLGYIRRYWDLGLIGLVYYVGIFADKVIYWFGPGGQVVANFYHVYPEYDSAMLLAYLLTVPALAVFLVHLETRFYSHYSELYRLIGHKGTLGQIAAAKRGMVEATKAAFRTIAKIQGVVAGAALIFSPQLVSLVGLSSRSARLFSVCVLAASVQMLMLVAILLLLYLDQRRPVAVTVLALAVSNGVLSLLTVGLGSQFYGLGYLAATIISTGVAIVAVRDRLNRLEYLTYTLQPIAPPRS